MHARHSHIARREEIDLHRLLIQPGLQEIKIKQPPKRDHRPIARNRWEHNAVISESGNLPIHLRGQIVLAQIQRTTAARAGVIKLLPVRFPCRPARVIAGERYLDSLRLTIDAQRLAVELGVSPMWRRIDQSLAAIDALGVLDRSETTVRADLQGLKRGLKRAWYPVQKGAAEALGDTRVRRIGNYLIDQPLREKVDALLMPGDVLIARKNWYLSNLGLPGFWPHAILYLGTPEKLAPFRRRRGCARLGEPADGGG